MGKPEKLKLIFNSDNLETNCELSDDALMIKALNDNVKAFTILVERYQIPLRRFCSYFLKNEQKGREIAQDVLLKLWKTRNKYKPDGKFKSYLFTIAKNLCCSKLRRQKVLSWINIDNSSVKDDFLIKGISNEEQLIKDEKIQMVLIAVNQLNNKYKLPLLLRFIDEMSYDDIAKILKINSSTARSRIHYGLKRVNRFLPDEVL